MFGWGSSSKAAPTFAELPSPTTDDEIRAEGESAFKQTVGWIDSDDWESAGSVKDVKAYKMPFENNPICLVKAVAEADLPAAEVYNYLGWHNGEVEFETINIGWDPMKVVDKYHEIVWTAIKCPFPLAERDFICLRHMRVENDRYFVIGKGVNWDRPLEKGRVRGAVNIGSWIVESLGENKCRLIRLVHADPKGNVPAFLINFAVTKTAEQVINFRTAAVEWVKKNGKK